MLKHLVLAILWFYAGWYAGALVAEFFGLSAFVGPIIGAAIALGSLGDPRRFLRGLAPRRTPENAAHESHAKPF
jgi:phosphate/sulfate permease